MKKIVPEVEFSAQQLNDIAALASQTGLYKQTVSILYGRGIDTADKIKSYLRPGKEKFLSPFLMKGMKEAVQLITRARDEDWSVVIYGDYDADGICASTVLCRALADFGIDAAVYVPERRCGYGLNCSSIDDIFEEYFPQLFITVDCGISNAKEVDYIKEQGAEVIVTDHHELAAILPDCICINPKIEDDYPYDNLCGAGVAFKLAVALNGKDAYKFLDFTTIATVADSVPLTGENRDIVAEGLRLINTSPRHNYSGFLKKDERVTSQSIAFSIAPKINAAGRMGDANAALRLFLSEDKSEIYDYTVKLTSYNLDRQKRCDELYASAKEMLRQKGVNGRIIVLGSDEWNSGFVGIVAARLVEEFCRPTLLFVKNGDSYKGSARSVDGVNIFEALKSCSHLIAEFGGHSQAAGVNVDSKNLAALEEELDKYLRENYPPEAFVPSYYVNGESCFPVPRKLIEELNLLEPYGVGNRRPQFVAEEGACRVRTMNAAKTHISVRVGGNDVVYFYGLKHARLLRSDVKKKLILEYVQSGYKGREQCSIYMRDVLYDRDALCGNLNAIGDGVAVTGLLSLSCGETECDRQIISRDDAREIMRDCGEYGTAFICYDPETLKGFDRGNLEVNLFNLASSNLASVILVCPSTSCDLSGYERVVQLDGGKRVYLPSLAGKTVFICDGKNGFDALKSLDVEREKLLGAFKLISANIYSLTGANLEEVAAENELGLDAVQLLFTLAVFRELNLVALDNGRLVINRGVKTQLSNSGLYNFVSSLK